MFAEPFGIWSFPYVSRGVTWSHSIEVLVDIAAQIFWVLGFQLFSIFLRSHTARTIDACWRLPLLVPFHLMVSIWFTALRSGLQKASNNHNNQSHEKFVKYNWIFFAAFLLHWRRGCGRWWCASATTSSGSNPSVGQGIVQSLAQALGFNFGTGTGTPPRCGLLLQPLRPLDCPSLPFTKTIAIFN